MGVKKDVGYKKAGSLSHLQTASVIDHPMLNRVVATIPHLKLTKLRSQNARSLSKTRAGVSPNLDFGGAECE